MNSKRTNPNFINGIPELLILKLISRKEMYGYEIVKQIKQRTQNDFSFGEGCIYPILHTLEKKKLLKSRSQEVKGRTRYYYSITTAGLKQLGELKQEWIRIIQGVSKIIDIDYV